MNKISKIILTAIIALQVMGCVTDSDIPCSFEAYDMHQRQAMLSYAGGDYESSLHSFELAFKELDNESENDYFHAAAAALNLSEFSKAEQLIIDAVVITNANKSYFENFDGFDGFRNKEELISIHKNYESYQRKYLKSLSDPSLDEQMDELIALDQKVRTGDFSRADRSQQDSLNVKRLIDITEEHGWQDKSWLILWHQRGTHNEDVYPWNYFRPLIDSLISECAIRPNYWAKYEDERLMMSEGYQKYGTYWSNYDTHPVQNVALVDELRAEVGLPPLWYMNKVYQSNLPDGYVMPKVSQNKP